LHDGKAVKRVGSIEIGNHVWLTSNTIVAKNVKIADGCIIAQGAVVTKSISESKSLVGGIPAKVIRQNIEWEK
jgi:acetyltransferase-like isoleucine patch superfamily enzyme